MRRSALALLSAIAACGHDPGPGAYANGEPFAECVPAASEDCAPSGRTFALAVCGDLRADNTLDVRGEDADVALWVRDAASTHAPLSVRGNYWSGSNQATNTQQISGTTTTDAPAPSCTRQVAVEHEASWDVRIDTPTSVVLQACSYAQPSLTVDNTLDVHVRGDVIWVIDRDLTIAAPLTVDVEPGSKLEWTLGGALNVNNTLDVAGPTHLYVRGPIHVAAPMQLAGSLIAPTSRIDVDNTLDIRGAAYVGDLHVAAPMRISGEAPLPENGCPPRVP